MNKSLLEAFGTDSEEFAKVLEDLGFDKDENVTLEEVFSKIDNSGYPNPIKCLLYFFTGIKCSVNEIDKITKNELDT